MFGNQQTPLTPEQRAEMQRRMQGMRAGAADMPDNLGQGLMSLGNALAYRNMQNQIGGQPPVSPVVKALFG